MTATATQTVSRHDSERGSWQMVGRDAASALRGVVRRYVGYDERWRGPLRRRETPHGSIVLILGLGPDLAVGRVGARPARHSAFVAGLHELPVVTEHEGEQLGVQVDLSPLAARMLLGVPLREVANRVVELDDLLGREARELVERLQETPAWEARFEAVDAFLTRRFAETSPPRPEVVQSFGLLAASHGRIGVETLAARTGFSRRHLTARFHEEIGLPPKTLARILRFERARSLLLADDGGRLAEIAHGCGYYDQPHLNRDFRELAGLAPMDFLACRLPDAGGISGEDLPFVQDGEGVAA